MTVCTSVIRSGSAALMQEFGYRNPMQVPRLDKIVVNMGVGEAVQDAKKIDAAVGDLTAITASTRW